jgi:hypothetical protein
MNKDIGLERHFCLTHNYKIVNEEQNKYAGQVSWRRRHLFVCICDISSYVYYS